MESKDNSLFYCNLEITDKNKELIETLENYSEENSKQVYVVNKALGTHIEYDYELSDIAIILIPKHSICIVNYGEKNDEDLEDFLDDLKEDIGHISDKYEYSKILGRVRKWDSELFKAVHIDDFDVSDFLLSEIKSENIRRIDLLISLLIGSINSIDKIGIDAPETLLDKVKRKIILFDGQQSRFIYGKPTGKRVTIQGLAGTGKTELLLNKLKEVYINSSDSVIAFTCYNKVLARELKDRKIPNFFNFMKVAEQIEWDSRLHVFPSWGSRALPETGMISYICCKYNTSFKTYKECRDFEKLCKEIRTEIEALDTFEPCFDYVFVDESQDFGKEFLALCEKVTKNNIYVAGDIFQNIFDSPSTTDIAVDYLLNKCYRTDPKTLMFAHAVGMGLYESPKINWLDDDDWKKCGYTFDRTSNMITLSRKPLRRFEDLDVTETIKLVPTDSDDIVSSVIEQLNEIKENNTNVSADDIAIIILDSNYNRMCQYANNIAYSIEDLFGWQSTRGYISKKTETNSIYISNINNIKGLEFPFLICVAPTTISKNIFSRNGIYTSLTRSFLTSYFIVDNKNEDFILNYTDALKQIFDGYIKITEPTASERERITTNIRNAKRERMPLDDIVDIIVSEFHDKGIEIDTVKTNAENLYKKHKNDAEVIERLRKICEQMI